MAWPWDVFGDRVNGEVRVEVRDSRLTPREARSLARHLRIQSYTAEGCTPPGRHDCPSIKDALRRVVFRIDERAQAALRASHATRFQADEIARWAARAEAYDTVLALLRGEIGTAK